MEKAHTDSERIRRFSAYRITEHWLVILLFTVLVVSGL